MLILGSCGFSEAEREERDVDSAQGSPSSDLYKANLATVLASGSNPSVAPHYPWNKFPTNYLDTKDPPLIDS